MINPSILAITLSLVACVWCGVVTAILVGQKRFYKELGKGVVKKDLQSILKQLYASFNEVGKQIESGANRLDQIEMGQKFHFQKMGFVRFNPFGDTGGDQSFCLCLLDDYNNGIVITSLHGRETTRLYAKEVRNSLMKREEFSAEEWQTYEQARQLKQVIEKRNPS